jgi:probable phosphoglycerate mutase
MIRHGPTAWNEDKRLQGHQDIPLSEAGRTLVSRWRVPSPVKEYKWVCSPLSRARETAELLGAEDLVVEPRLMEMDYGNWEGSRLVDLRKDLGDEMSENEARGLDFQPPHGETPREVQERLKPFLMDVAGSGQPTMAVAHHGVLRALYALATGWSMVESPQEKFQRGAMHSFNVTEKGHVSVDRINISIDPK